MRRFKLISYCESDVLCFDDKVPKPIPQSVPGESSPYYKVYSKDMVIRGIRWLLPAQFRAIRLPGYTRAAYRVIPVWLTVFYIRYPGDFYVPPTFIFTYLPRAFTHACRQNPQNVWHKTFFQSLKTLNFFTNFDNFTAFYKFRQFSHFLAFFYTIRHSTNLEFFTAFYKFRHLLCILFIAYIFFIFP